MPLSTHVKLPSFLRRGKDEESVKSSRSSQDSTSSLASEEPRRPRKLSKRRFSSLSSLRLTALADHKPSSVFQNSQPMNPFLVFSQAPESLDHVLRGILDAPGGRRSLARLGRTCRTLLEPAVGILWKELPSLVPLLGLFPAQTLKRAKKPGMGFAKPPEDEDWKGLEKYNGKVESITYDERLSNVAPTVFPILEGRYGNKETTGSYLLPNLKKLTFRVDSPAGLERCRLFLSPHLESLTLDLGLHCTQLGGLLADLSTHIKLTKLVITTHMTLPSNFADLMKPQSELERIALLAPGAITSSNGKWLASLTKLKVLELDLSKTSGARMDINGFFDVHFERPRSGMSNDSGVFSGEEQESFFDRRKGRQTNNGNRTNTFVPFKHLEQLVLTGNAKNVASFLYHIESDVKQLDVFLHDLNQENSWEQIFEPIPSRFADSLRLLKVGSAPSSKITELVKSATRGTPAPKEANLAFVQSLSSLTRLDLDISESISFTEVDIQHLVGGCPNLEELRLCPLAKYPVGSGAPKLALESLIPLLSGCPRLHTLAVAVNARRTHVHALSAPSSLSLHTLHVGHSWIQDPLSVAILLAHLAPCLKNLKWFHERNRPGYVEANARGWEMVAEAVPLLQTLVYVERRNTARLFENQIMFMEQAIPEPKEYLEMGIQCQAAQIDSGSQTTAIETRDVMIYVMPDTQSIGVGETRGTMEQEIDATYPAVSQSVQVSVGTEEKGIDAEPPQRQLVEKVVDATMQAVGLRNPVVPSLPRPLPMAIGLTNWAMGLAGAACRVFILYPLSVPSRITQRVLTVPGYLYGRFVVNTVAERRKRERDMSQKRRRSRSAQSVGY